MGTVLEEEGERIGKQGGDMCHGYRCQIVFL